MPPLKSLPSGDPSGGVIYLWIVLSPEEASQLMGNSQHVLFLRRGVVSTSPNPQVGGPPLISCLRLIKFIHSYPPYWRPFLHPQPEDTPCCGDRDPHSWPKILHSAKTQQATTLKPDSGLPQNLPFLALEVLNL
jgi:hypothetical protein